VTTRERCRHARVKQYDIDLAERTGAALVTGLGGASSASIEARVGDPARAASTPRPPTLPVADLDLHVAPERLAGDIERLCRRRGAVLTTLRLNWRG
jgi:hypothetical protein